MTTQVWQPGAAPAGYDSRLTLAGFIYDSCRQMDYHLHDRGVRVLPDDGLLRRVSNDSTAWLVPTVIGADVIQPQVDGSIVYTGQDDDGMEVWWTVYTADSGAPGTTVGEFPAQYHAHVVAGVIALLVGRAVPVVDGETRRIAEPFRLRGVYTGVNRFQRVESDTRGFLQTIVSAAATAYVEDELSPSLEVGYSPVDYVGLGLTDGSWDVVYRWYDMATGLWQDDDPAD